MKLKEPNLTKSLTILVPFYNESRTIARLIFELELLYKEIHFSCIFINDGSEDNSLSLLQEKLDSASFTSKIINKTNGGKASAIRSAQNNIESSHLVVLDADLELKTSDVARAWEIVLKSESEIVFGYRSFIAQSSYTYRYARGNHILSHLYGLLFNEVITDVMCGLKLIPTNIFNAIPFKYRGFSMEVEIPMFLWTRNLRPFEIPIAYKPRGKQEGKVIGIKDAFLIILHMVTFRVLNRRKDLN